MHTLIIHKLTCILNCEGMTHRPDPVSRDTAFNSSDGLSSAAVFLLLFYHLLIIMILMDFLLYTRLVRMDGLSFSLSPIHVSCCLYYFMYLYLTRL